MTLRIIQNSRVDMTRLEYSNSTWAIVANRCPVTITQDMVGKTIFAQVWEKWVGWEVSLSFFLLEDVE